MCSVFFANVRSMALISLEFDFFVKSCRHFIGILAWTWAIFVFCLSYIGRSNSYSNNDHYYLNDNNRNAAPSLYRTVFLPVLKVLLVAPSASLAGPVPSPSPTVSTDTATAANSAQVQATGAASGHPVVIPWGPGLAGGPAQATPLGGFIYCAGCSPINTGQLVIPANIPWNRALSASGVIPPPIAKAGRDGLEQQLNGLGNEEEPGKEQRLWDDGGIPVQEMALHDDGRYRYVNSFSKHLALV